MASIELYSQDGTKKTPLTVSDEVFHVASNQSLVHQAVRTQLANRRSSIAHTKTRGEVRGGGKKPWKQKGTGRARHGSTRSPIWVGGGVTFGPRSERNFTLRINRKAKKKAMRMVLSDKLSEGKFFAIESIELAKPKTKDFSAVLAKWPLKGDMLLIIDGKNENLEIAAKNLDNVWVARPESLSITDILKYRRIAAVPAALKKLEKLFA